MEIYQQAWKGIVKPVQIKARIGAFGANTRTIKGKDIVRKDLSITNRNGKQLQGFIFGINNQQPQYTVLYLHGNGGSKSESLPLVQFIPDFNFNLVAFDMLGCGNSDPQVLTYGVNEVFDIREMIQQVRTNNQLGKLVLWGRSMGSLCAIMFAQLYSYQVVGLVLDSPFRSLQKVVERIASRKVNLPLMMLKPILYMIRRRAVQEVGFDLFDIDYLSVFKKLTPHLAVLFVFSNFDSVVPAFQVLDFYNAYTGPKDLCQIYRTHDEDRPEDLFRQGLLWLTRQKKQGKTSLYQAREQLQQQRRTRQVRKKQQIQPTLHQNKKKNEYCC